jgi:DnaJ-class molecular chaperone
MSDNEGLPPGFVPAWTFIKTKDGVVEYEHEGGEVARRAMEQVRCPDCAGLGWVLLRRSGSVTADCRTCEGTGRVSGDAP